MPSSKRVGARSERLKGKNEEEGVRRGETGVFRIPSPFTASEPMF